MTLALLGNSGFHLPITGMLVFAVFFLLLAGWLVFTLVIRYHWKNYGTGGVEIFSMNFFYFTGSFIGIALMLISASLYFFSAT